MTGSDEPAAFTGSEAVPLDSLLDCSSPDRCVRVCADRFGDVVQRDCECLWVQSG